MQEIVSHPWFRYVIGGVAIGIFVLRYFLQGMKETSSAPVKFAASESSSLSDQQKFSIALNAVISSYSNVDTNILSFTKNGKKSRQVDTYLKRWRINTREGYLGLTDYYFTDGRRAYFNFIYPLFKSVPREEWNTKMQEQFGDNERAQRILTVFDKHKIIDYWKSEGIIEFDSDVEIGSLGWDISNLIGQARRAFTAQLITEEEAWDIIGRATEMAKENFNSWEEFGKSMIIGFTIDMFKRKDIEAHYLEDSVRIYKLTVTDPSSPWNTIEWQK